MRFLYSNLADSIHFNNTASYVSPDIMTHYVIINKPDGKKTHINYPDQRAKQLKSEMESVLKSSDCILGFTLNQVADNPVFYKSTSESEELFDLLVELLESKKAFISTFNDNTASSYELNNIISSWKRICDDETDDLRFVSSLVEELSNIRGDVDPKNEMIIHYSDRIKRNAHKAVFGFDRLVTVSGKGKDIIWHSSSKGNIVTHRMSIIDYLKEMKEYSKRSEKLGYYTGLLRGKSYEGMSKEAQLFIQRIQHINKIMGCYPNDSFVIENEVTLSKVMDEIIHTDILDLLYTETIDSALEKQIRDKKQDLLDTARAAFTIIAKRANRSQMYEAANKGIKEHMIKLMGYADTSGHRNPGYTLVLSFFFQVIDFCYNFFNCLQCFGVRNNVEFHFSPYYSRNLSRKTNNEGHVESPFDKQRKGDIIISNDIYKNKVMYTIENSNHECVGSYTHWEYAKTALEKRANASSEKLYHIVDRQGSIII